MRNKKALFMKQVNRRVPRPGLPSLFAKRRRRRHAPDIAPGAPGVREPILRDTVYLPAPGRGHMQAAARPGAGHRFLCRL